MQDFVFGRVRAQEVAPKPYTLYNKEQSLDEAGPGVRVLQDFEYFKSMYPARVKELQLHVEAVLDEVDYQGSPMYDEYPDRLMVDRLRRKVEERLNKESEEKAAQPAVQPVEQKEMETYEISAGGSRETGTLPVSSFVIPRTPHGPFSSCGKRTCELQALEVEAGGGNCNKEAGQMTGEREPDSEMERTQESGNILEIESRQKAGAEPGVETIRQSEKPPEAETGRENEASGQEEAALEQAQELESRRPGPPRPGDPWGPPPPPPRPGNPWGPPPPPPRPGNPWGPPPPPPRPGNPWGPPPPPPRPGNPWGPPPPPPRPGNPWGPPPPPRPGSRIDLGDVINLLLFGGMQHRRCRNRHCL